MHTTLPKPGWKPLLTILLAVSLSAVFPLQPGQAQPILNSKENEQYKRAEAELEKAMIEIEKALAELRRMDLPSLQAELRQSLQALAAQKEEMSRQLDRELAAIDTELKQMKGHVNAASIQQDLRNAMLEAEREMGRAQEELQQHKLYIQNDIAKELRQASIELQESKKNIGLMKQGLELMREEGLIPKWNDRLQIEYRSDDLLYINGKAQSKAVSDKYRRYFGKGRFEMGGSSRRRPV